MIGRAFLGIIALFLLIGAFSGAIISGIHGWRTQDISKEYVITTGAGVFSTDIELEHDLYQAATDEVYVHSSNITGENPVADSYVEATKVLTITNLNEDDTRVLTLSYYAETDDDTMRIVGPFLGILVFGGLSFAIIYGVIKGR